MKTVENIIFKYNVKYKYMSLKPKTLKLSHHTWVVTLQLHVIETLIKRAVDLYGRILTEVLSTDQMQ